MESFVLIIRRHLGELLTLAPALDRQAYTRNHIDLHLLFDLVYKVQGFESFFHHYLSNLSNCTNSGAKQVRFGASDLFDLSNQSQSHISEVIE